MTGFDLEAGLVAAVKKYISADAALQNLHRVTAGASQETWSFDAVSGAGTEELILRRPPGGVPDSELRAERQKQELAIVQIAFENGVKAPEVKFVLEPDDNLGVGFVMRRIPGDTLAPHINRSEEYAATRPLLARQCGEVIAPVHAISLDKVGFLETITPEQQWQNTWESYESYFEEPSPVFELAFRYVKERMPAQDRVTLVHGDFRHGNIMYGHEGVPAILDWEIAHIGDPMEDLAWICVNSWRFGGIDKPVGGFGEREDLFAGYEAASGVQVDPDRVKYWEIFGSLRWGVTCRGMAFTHLDGHDRSVERAAIGRRSSECEADLMILLG